MTLHEHVVDGVTSFLVGLVEAAEAKRQAEARAQDARACKRSLVDSETVEGAVRSCIPRGWAFSVAVCATEDAYEVAFRPPGETWARHKVPSRELYADREPTRALAMAAIRYYDDIMAATYPPTKDEP